MDFNLSYHINFALLMICLGFLYLMLRKSKRKIAYELKALLLISMASVVFVYYKMQKINVINDAETFMFVALYLLIAAYIVAIAIVIVVLVLAFIKVYKNQFPREIKH